MIRIYANKEQKKNKWIKKYILHSLFFAPKSVKCFLSVSVALSMKSGDGFCELPDKIKNSRGQKKDKGFFILWK